MAHEKQDVQEVPSEEDVRNHTFDPQEHTVMRQVEEFRRQAIEQAVGQSVDVHVS